MHGIRNCTLGDLLSWRRAAHDLRAASTVAAINREIDRRTRPARREPILYGSAEHWAGWQRFDAQRRAMHDREMERRSIPEGGWQP